MQKLSSIIHKHGTEQFSANELAQYLHMTPRSARRILNELEMTGLAKVVVEECPRQTGRPRKIYQLQLNV
ncbi:HTH domain-containing protein [Kurthia sp. FSL E2-0154]|uniref:HTH domain-containing protein n=1 Tax=Kurthia sp. FSL E2-0154 TaxID=2921358 RepID=UPI0030F7AA6E